MADDAPLSRRLLWFVGLWLVGFLTLTGVGMLIRLAIGL